LVRAVVWSCSLWLASKRWHHMALPDVVVVAGVVVALWVIFFNAEIDFRFGLLLLASCSFDRKQNVVGHTSAPLFVFVAKGRRKLNWVFWLFVFTLKLVKYELQFRYPIVTFDIFWGLWTNVPLVYDQKWFVHSTSNLFIFALFCLDNIAPYAWCLFSLEKVLQ